MPRCMPIEQKKKHPGRAEQCRDGGVLILKVSVSPDWCNKMIEVSLRVFPSLFSPRNTDRLYNSETHSKIFILLLIQTVIIQ